MSGVSREDLREVIRGLAPVIKEYVQSEIGPIQKRLTEIETKGVEYKGVFQAAQQYERGNLVTLKGSMWHANVVTRSVPGTSNDWTLCVKAGRDAR